MQRPLRRLRGTLMRLALGRRAAIVVGILLATPAMLLVAEEYAWESWATDGAALVSGATGAALVLAGVMGRRPDWIEES